MKIKYVLPLIAILSGCVNSGALQTGQDTYVISTRVTFTGMAGAKRDALESANEFCAAMQKSILVKRINANECMLRGGCAEAEVHFMCSNSSETQISPSFVRDPDFILETRRR